MAPRSQKASDRPIAFRLEDGQGGDTTLGLVIRPEDLTHSETALQTPVQTLGGAFLDDFGPGIATIQISGHTGWGSGKRPDGHQAFLDLHAQVWTKWHAARKAAIAAGRSPVGVRLTLIDDLDELVRVVAPGAFSLKRSRASPLLARYAISMTVLSDQITPKLVDPIHLVNADRPSMINAGLTSLQSSISTLTNAAANIHNFVDSTVAAPLRNLIGTATSAMSQVMTVVGAARGAITTVVSPFVGIASDLSLLGRNVFNTYNAVANLPDFAMQAVSTVASAFQNAFCVLNNAFTKADEYPNYDAIYGASNCSSTVGGSPVSPLLGVNPWEVILPDNPMVAAVTPEARANIDLLKTTDPVLAPMSSGELTSRVSSVLSGLSLSWL